MKKTALIAAMGFMAAFSVAGCTPEAREDVGEAGGKIGSATEKSVEGTAEATKKAGEAVKEGAENAGEAVAGAAKTAGKEVKQGAENVGEAVGGAVKTAAKETQDAGQSMTLTPKVKNALVVNKQIDASTIDVDTSGEKDTVILKGTVRSESEKKLAEQVARKALADAKSNFKLKNQLTVAKK